MTQVELANGEKNEAFKKALQQTIDWNNSFSWPEVQTFVYREVDGVKIEADVYAREAKPVDHEKLGKSPVMLFIHGGGWMGGTRTDFSKPVFHEFLTRGFVVVSIDYRFLPEVDFVKGQLDDVASSEAWIREKLQSKLKERGINVEIDTDAIVVVGGSAGAHLAALTPKVWKKKPKSILLISGPTNLLNLRKTGRPLGGGALSVLANFIPQDPSPEFIRSAIYDTPQTNLAPTPGLEGFMKPRSLLSLSVFVREVMPEFIARGLVDGKLPEKGTVPEEEMKYISPIFSDLTDWPATFQLAGDSDEAWDASQLTTFHDKLRQNGISSGVLIVPESSHAFENFSKINDKIHLRYLQPACEFVIRFVMEDAVEKDEKKI